MKWNNKTHNLGQREVTYRGLDSCQEPARHKTSRAGRTFVRLEAWQRFPRRHQGRTSTLQLNLTQQTGDLKKQKKRTHQVAIGTQRQNAYLLCVLMVRCLLGSLKEYLHGIDSGAFSPRLHHQLEVVLREAAVETQGHDHLAGENSISQNRTAVNSVFCYQERLSTFLSKSIRNICRNFNPKQLIVMCAYIFYVWVA